jgi:hypothetical protein
VRGNAAVLLSTILAGVWNLAGAQNVITNADFETSTSEGALPAKWGKWIPQSGPEIRLANEQAHSGTHSISIRTRTDAHAISMSEPIAVAPGEKLTLSAWCKAQDISTSGAGTYGIAAGWMDGAKNYLDEATYETGPSSPGADWFELTTQTIVPDRAAFVTFQVRHRGVTGTTWWDDVELRPATRLALRYDFAMPTAEPGVTSLPVVIINRDKSLAGTSISVETGAGKPQQVQLSSAVETTTSLKFDLQGRGRQKLRASILDPAGGRPAFTATRDVKVPDALVMEPILPCYSCIEDSGTTIQARVWVHQPQDARSSMQLVAKLHRVGRDKAEQAVATTTHSASLENILELTVGELAKLGKGDYELQVQLVRGQQVLASGVQDWHVISREQAHVTMGPDGWLRVAGKKSLPMGLYDGDDFPELAQAGLNVTQNFDVGHVRRGFLPDNVRMKRMLDEGMRVGMKHLFLVSHGPGCRLLDEEYLRRLQMFKNHPGVLAWYEEEGVARGDVPLSFLSDLHTTVKKLAPEHPLVIGDTRDVIMKMGDRSNFFPVEYMDAGIWWWYPFPIRKGGRPGAYEGEEIGDHLELVPPSFLTLAKTEKPIWVVLQSYKKGNGRFPTEAEYRAQPYISIIHGAKGLFWYTGSYTGGVQVNREEGHYDYLRKLWRELREMEPVFTAPDARDKVSIETAGQFMEYRLKDTGDAQVLLAVNRDDKPTSASFAVDGFSARNVKVRYENRTLNVTGGRVADNFGPYAVHVYELNKNR